MRIVRALYTNLQYGGSTDTDTAHAGGKRTVQCITDQSVPELFLSITTSVDLDKRRLGVLGQRDGGNASRWVPPAPYQVLGTACGRVLGQ